VAKGGKGRATRRTSLDDFIVNSSDEEEEYEESSSSGAGYDSEDSEGIASRARVPAGIADADVDLQSAAIAARSMERELLEELRRRGVHRQLLPLPIHVDTHRLGDQPADLWSLVWIRT
jgi:hypothetical protein